MAVRQWAGPLAVAAGLLAATWMIPVIVRAIGR